MITVTIFIWLFFYKFKLTRSPQEGPDEPARLEIQFKDAVPIRVENLEDGTVRAVHHKLTLFDKESETLTPGRDVRSSTLRCPRGSWT